MLEFFFKSLLRRKSNKEKLVQQLRANCSSLMMERDEEVLFAPIAGMYEGVRMWGAINPTFEFKAYDPSRKEFMIVRAELSQPDRIRVYTRTADEWYVNNEDGTLIKVHPAHLTSLNLFLKHIALYFPFLPGHKIKKGPNELPKGIVGEKPVVQVQNGEGSNKQGSREVHRADGESDDGGAGPDRKDSSVVH